MMMAMENRCRLNVDSNTMVDYYEHYIIYDDMFNIEMKEPENA